MTCKGNNAKKSGEYAGFVARGKAKDPADPSMRDTDTNKKTHEDQTQSRCMQQNC